MECFYEEEEGEEESQELQDIESYPTWHGARLIRIENLEVELP